MEEQLRVVYHLQTLRYILSLDPNVPHSTLYSRAANFDWCILCSYFSLSLSIFYLNVKILNKGDNINHHL